MKSKIKVNTKVTVICEGCGANTVLDPKHAYMLATDVMCNCDGVSQEVDLTSAPAEQSDDDALTGIMYAVGQGAKLSDFSEYDQKLYAAHMIYSVDNAVSEGYEMSEEEQADYDAFKEILADEEITKVELSLDDLKGKTSEEIKAGYNMDELRVLGKAVGVKKYSQLGEDKLIGRLLEKVN